MRPISSGLTSLRVSESLSSRLVGGERVGMGILWSRGVNLLVGVGLPWESRVYVPGGMAVLGS